MIFNLFSCVYKLTPTVGLANEMAARAQNYRQTRFIFEA